MREELRDRIRNVIDDDTVMHSFIDRFIGSAVFNFQRLGDAMDVAEKMVDNEGLIVSEKEALRTIERFRDRQHRLDLFERMWNLEMLGEFLAIPASS